MKLAAGSLTRFSQEISAIKRTCVALSPSFAAVKENSSEAALMKRARSRPSNYEGQYEENSA